MSWASDAWYDIQDALTTSKAERNRNTYRDLVNFLTGKIKTLEADIEQAESDISTLHRCYLSNGDGCKGYMVDAFNNKEAVFYSNAIKMIKAMKNARDSINSKLCTAKEKQRYWQGIADKEDREKREYK